MRVESLLDLYFVTITFFDLIIMYGNQPRIDIKMVKLWRERHNSVSSGHFVGRCISNKEISQELTYKW